MNLRDRVLRLERRLEARTPPESRWTEQTPDEALGAFLERVRGTRARLVRLAPGASADDCEAAKLPGVRFVVPASPPDWERQAVAHHAQRQNE